MRQARIKTGKASKDQAKKKWLSLGTFEGGCPRTSWLLDFRDEAELKVTSDLEQLDVWRYP